MIAVHTCFPPSQPSSKSHTSSGQAISTNHRICTSEFYIKLYHILPCSKALQASKKNKNGVVWLFVVELLTEMEMSCELRLSFEGGVTQVGIVDVLREIAIANSGRG